MAHQTHRAGWISRGWMSFTVANGGVLHLGGASTTTPTSQISVSDYLAAGIPQTALKTRFLDVVMDGSTGHAIKHAIITIVSAGATSPAGRKLTNGSTPTTSLGAQVLSPDSFTIENSPSAIFNFKLFNRSGGDMVVEVEPFE